MKFWIVDEQKQDLPDLMIKVGMAPTTNLGAITEARRKDVVGTSELSKYCSPATLEIE